jgi:hypothetical protein
MTLVTTPFADPKFYDKRIQDLNTELAKLGWITKQYPLCYLGEDDEGTFPEVYKNDGSGRNIRVMPEGDAVSFFQIEGDMVEVDDFQFLTQFSLTVWGDLRKITTSKDYDYTSDLIKDVITTLRANACYYLVIDVRTPLDGFSYLAKLNEQNTMRPFTAFKINFLTNLYIC